LALVELGVKPGDRVALFAANRPEWHAADFANRGKGGQYLILPPDYAGEIPPGYFTYRSGTYGVFVFWRGFFHRPEAAPRTRAGDGADADLPAREEGHSQADAIPRRLRRAREHAPSARWQAVDMLWRYIDTEYVDPADMDMRGMVAALGIVKGQPFAPDAKARALLDKAARTATRMGHVMAYTPSPLLKDQLWYGDRHYINGFPGNATFTSPSFAYLDARAAFFTYAYSASPRWRSAWTTSARSISPLTPTPTAIF